MQVRIIMRKEVIFVKKDTNIAEISQIMLEKGIRSVIVCNDDKTVAGIITDTDILARGLGICNVYETHAEKIMTKNPVTASPDDSVFSIIKTMGEKKFRRMPVIDEKNKLIGLISIGDIAPHIMLHMELLRDSL